jgi:hypothetical protein
VCSSDLQSRVGLDAETPGWGLKSSTFQSEYGSSEALEAVAAKASAPERTNHKAGAVVFMHVS